MHSCFSWESGWNWWPWIRKEVVFATAILLPFDSLGFERKIFVTIVMGNWDACWIGMDLGWCGCVCVCVAPQRESCYELVAPAHVRMCIVTSSPAIPCSGMVLRKVVDWKVEYYAWHSTMRYDGMTNFHGENSGAVSILHGDGKSNHLANGVGSDGSELCPVTLIMLNHTITKSAGRLQTSPTDIAGAVGNVSKCRRASTLRILNERKFQFCFHLTHWDSKASFFFNGHAKWDACWIGMDLGWFGCVCVCVCVAPQRESCYELVAPAHVRMCIVTSSPAIPCSGKKVLRKVVDWKVEY